MFAAAASSAAPAPKLTPQQTDFFEKKIRPVLVKDCYKCHSAEGGRIKGGLRLDTRDGLLKGGDSGPAIVPGNPDSSLLIRAIRYRDRNLQMPPEDKKLPAAQIADLEAWVRMGAPDPRADAPNKYGAASTDPKQHWSFQPIFKPIIPDFRKDWTPLARNAVDNYVFATLEAKQLAPAPRADKVTLIRRATFNLTGLPPTLAEVNEFIADESPNAFEKVVDRLLASPRYGERWGRHWLDVARYGDTTGRRNNNRGETRYLHSHTYRDWVIKSFNDDRPFDQFAKLQIAADRLVEANDDNAKPQTPNSKPSRSDLAALGFITLGPRLNNNGDDLIDDRIDVVMKGFQALSVTCARCHDHKFDPIPTKDYYSLHGVFASSTEPREGIELPVSKDTPEFKEFQKAITEAEGELKKFDDGLRARARAELVARISDYFKALADFANPTNTASLNQFMQRRNLLPSVAAGWNDALDKAKDQHDPVLSIWHEFARLPANDFLKQATPIALRLRTPAATNDTAKPVNPLVARALGSPPGSIAVVATNMARLFADANARWFQMVSQHAAKTRTGGTNAPPAPTALPEAAQEQIRRIIYEPGSPAYLFTDEKVEASLRRLRDMGPVRDQQQRLTRAVDDLRSNHPGAPPRAVVLNDSPQSRDSYVYIKGNRGSRGPNVPRQFLEILSGEGREPFRDGSGRLELANHIASPDNPLTARVMVNRVWLHQFGEGIVRTANDFGLRADPPTHPELLDYLAWQFMEGGWSVKKLQKLIMLSHAWQQSSEDNPRFAQVDPENRWLWQQNRRRLEFEALRDTVLHIGGKLNFKMGGPGERLDRPDSDGEYSDRRSVYGLVDRANLPNMLGAFDFANPDISTGQRNHTIVPQQALFMMNSPLVIEQARNTVQRGDLKSLPTDADRVKMLYRLIYSRQPTDTELKLALNYLFSEVSAPKGPLPGQPPWEYGLGNVDARTGRVGAFWPLLYSPQSRFYQASARIPDGRTGYFHLSANGGHPGLMMTQSAIRRWTATDDLLVSIEGALAHTGQNSDGVQGQIVYSGAGVLLRGVAMRNEVTFAVPRLMVKAGETIDFVVDCRAGGVNDTFTWSPIIKELDPQRTTATAAVATGKQWNAQRDFAAPVRGQRLYPWEKLAQILLETTELTFVN
ncbi:MAG: PSD1 and planctomycete cytochrome C domain-containing protein [Limisphaerales bacterium]